MFQKTVSSVSFCFQDANYQELCLRYTARNFNENPSMWAVAKISRARASEHSSNFCEQFEQRPNFASTFKLDGTIRYPRLNPDLSHFPSITFETSPTLAIYWTSSKWNLYIFVFYFMWGGEFVEGSVGSPWTRSVVGVGRPGICVFGLPLSQDNREKLAERGFLLLHSVRTIKI